LIGLFEELNIVLDCDLLQMTMWMTISLVLWAVVVVSRSVGGKTRCYNYT